MVHTSYKKQNSVTRRYAEAEITEIALLGSSTDMATALRADGCLEGLEAVVQTRYFYPMFENATPNELGIVP